MDAILCLKEKQLKFGVQVAEMENFQKILMDRLALYAISAAACPVPEQKLEMLNEA